MTAQPDWDRIEADVAIRLHLLRGAWEESENMPALREAMIRDLYIPALKHLGAFCAAITVESVEDDKRDGGKA
jgi:hypothetical protein